MIPHVFFFAMPPLLEKSYIHVNVPRRIRYNDVKLADNAHLKVSDIAVYPLRR